MINRHGRLFEQSQGLNSGSPKTPLKDGSQKFDVSVFNSPQSPLFQEDAESFKKEPQSSGLLSHSCHLNTVNLKELTIETGSRVISTYELSEIKAEIAGFIAANEQLALEDDAPAVLLFKKYEKELSKDNFEELIKSLIDDFSSFRRWKVKFAYAAYRLLIQYRNIFKPSILSELVAKLVDSCTRASAVNGWNSSSFILVKTLSELIPVVNNSIELLTKVIKCFSSIIYNANSNSNTVVAASSALTLLKEYNYLIATDTNYQLMLKTLFDNCSDICPSTQEIRCLHIAKKVLKYYLSIANTEDEKITFNYMLFSLVNKCSARNLRGQTRDIANGMGLLKKYLPLINCNTFIDLVKNLSLNENLGLDICFNHLNNNESGSILTFINLLADQELKIKRMESTIEFLNAQEDISSIIAALEDVLYTDLTYIQNPIINKFIIDKLFFNKITAAETRAVKFNINEVQAFLTYFFNMSEDIRNSFMLEHNFFMNQLFYYIHNLPADLELNQYLQQEIKKIIADYLAIDKINKVVAVLSALGEDMATNYVFVAKDFQVLVINEKYYQRWLLNDEQQIVSAANAFLFDAMSVNVSINNIENLFTKFKVFEAAYFFHIYKRKLIDLIKMLGLGENEEFFLKALSQNGYRVDLTTPHAQNILAGTFQNYVEGGANIIGLTGNDVLNISLTEEHFQQIVLIYGEILPNVADQAQLLLGLAAFFTRLSSSWFFGTENNSPIPLRNYALALLNKALILFPQLIAEIYLMEGSDNWKNKLSGALNSFSCSEILSGIMFGELRARYPQMLGITFPPAWH